MAGLGLPRTQIPYLGVLVCGVPLLPGHPGSSGRETAEKLKDQVEWGPWAQFSHWCDHSNFIIRGKKSGFYRNSYRISGEIAQQKVDTRDSGS